MLSLQPPPVAAVLAAAAPSDHLPHRQLGLGIVLRRVWVVVPLGCTCWRARVYRSRLSALRSCSRTRPVGVLQRP